jgi:hypothetical protein
MKMSFLVAILLSGLMTEQALAPTLSSPISLEHASNSAR